jgi:excisionase family DNA binding protein
MNLSKIKDDRAYRIDEIAHILRIEPRTIRRWINCIEDPLPAFKRKRTYRVAGSDLKEYLNKHEHKPWE